MVSPSPCASRVRALKQALLFLCTSATPVRAHLEQARDLCRETGDESTEATVLNGLGEVLLATGRPADARARRAGALELASRVGEKYEQARPRRPRRPGHLGPAGRAPGLSSAGGKPTPCTPACVPQKLT
jgi:hypothetical protein